MILLLYYCMYYIRACVEVIAQSLDDDVNISVSITKNTAELGEWICGLKCLLNLCQSKYCICMCGILEMQTTKNPSFVFCEKNGSPFRTARTICKLHSLLTTMLDIGLLDHKHL